MNDFEKAAKAFHRQPVLKAKAQDLTVSVSGSGHQSGAEALGRITSRYREQAEAASPDALKASGLDQFSKSDKEQASSRLREETKKGESLQEWFEKKKTGKDCDAAMPPDADLIPTGDT